MQQGQLIIDLRKVRRALCAHQHGVMATNPCMLFGTVRFVATAFRKSVRVCISSCRRYHGRLTDETDLSDLKAAHLSGSRFRGDIVVLTSVNTLSTAAHLRQFLIMTEHFGRRETEVRPVQPAVSWSH